MNGTAYSSALFATPLGACGIAWSLGRRVESEDRGDGGEVAIAGLQLPAAREPETRERLRRRFPGALWAKPPAAVADAIARLDLLLAGAPVDLEPIPLDWRAVAPFERRVYEAARRIPPGATLTYGELAWRIGEPGAARAVGRALGRNPFAIIVPCHRVVAAAGRTGGFSAPGGTVTKLRLLQLERGDALQGLPLGDLVRPT